MNIVDVDLCYLIYYLLGHPYFQHSHTLHLNIGKYDLFSDSSIMIILYAKSVINNISYMNNFDVEICC